MWRVCLRLTVTIFIAAVPAVLNGQSYCSWALELINSDAETYGCVRIADSDQLEPPTFTLEAWITPRGPGWGSTTDGWGAVVLCKSRENSSGVCLCSYGFGWDPNTETVLAYVAHELGRSHTALSSIATVPLGTTRHVAASFDGYTLRIYLDGSLDNEVAAVASTIDYGPHDLLIGAGNFASQWKRRFQGVIDDVRVWDHALDEDQLAARMTCTLDVDEAGLLAYYPFSWSDTSDASGHGHHGVAEGTVSFIPVADPPCLIPCDAFESGDTSAWTVVEP